MRRALAALVAMLCGTSMVPWPAVAGYHAHHHAVTLAWAHGQLHVVLRHTDPHHGERTRAHRHEHSTAPRTSPLHGDDAGHVLHVAPAPTGLRPNVACSVQPATLCASAAPAAITLTPPPAWHCVSPLPDLAQAIAFLRTTVLLV